VGTLGRKPKYIRACRKWGASARKQQSEKLEAKHNCAHTKRRDDEERLRDYGLVCI
jgi:hypothetical protein